MASVFADGRGAALGAWGVALLCVANACGGVPRAEPVGALQPLGPAPPDAERHRLTAANTAVAVVVTAVTDHSLRFERLEGELVFSPSEPARSQVELRLDTRSARASWDLVEQVAQQRFLVVDRYPEASFRGHALREGRELFVVGELTVRATTRALRVPVVLTVEPCILRVDSAFTIDRQELGVATTGVVEGVVGDDITVTIAIAVVRPTAPATCQPGAR